MEAKKSILILALTLLITSICTIARTYGCPIIYVDVNATGSNNGTSWADAYKYPQDALEDANISPGCVEIWMAAGTYKPDCNSAEPNGSGDRTSTFGLINNVAIYGGFPSGGGAWESRDYNAHKTILSGDIGVICDGNDNSYHVVTGNDTNETAMLDGFTITKGNTNGSSPYDNGGGMCNYGSPKVTNCIFIGNQGSGMYNYYNSPTVTNCTFNGNSTWGNGGGMYNYYSSPIVTNCTFNGNSAGGYGGGGMCNFFRQTYNNSDLTITNCIFSGNSANDVGGGMYIYAISRMMITNCTFSGNMAGRGGGFYSNFESRTTVKNCILWGNEGKQISLTASVTYSDIEGGWAGTGNIDVDPCFVKPGYWGDVNDPNIPREPNEPNAIWIDGNYRLQSDSPCIDAGNNNSVPPDYVDLDRDGNTTEPTPLDIDDFPRFIDGDCNGTAIVDMGTYEFLHGDINHNGSVNFIDFAILASQWFQSNCGECCGADLTCDGQVNWADLREFAEHWLAGTAP